MARALSSTKAKPRHIQRLLENTTNHRPSVARTIVVERVIRGNDMSTATAAYNRIDRRSLQRSGRPRRTGPNQQSAINNQPIRNLQSAIRDQTARRASWRRPLEQTGLSWQDIDSISCHWSLDSPSAGTVSKACSGRAVWARFTALTILAWTGRSQ